MPNPFGFGRHVFLKSGGHIGVPLPLTLVQYATAQGVDSNHAAVFGTALTPGNVVLVALGLRYPPPSQSVGPTLTQIGTTNYAVLTGSGPDTYIASWYRKVQSGDGATFNFVGAPNIGNYGILAAEFSGLDTASAAANITNGGPIASATVSAVTGGASYDAGFLSGVTRLEYQDPTHYGILTPNAASTRVAPADNIGNGAYGGLVFMSANIGGIFILYGAGNATLGGSQSGVTRDGYNYAYNGYSWPRASF